MVYWIAIFLLLNIDRSFLCWLLQIHFIRITSEDIVPYCSKVVATFMLLTPFWCNYCNNVNEGNGNFFCNMRYTWGDVYPSRSEYLISSGEKCGRSFCLYCCLWRSSSKMKEVCVSAWFATYEEKFSNIELLFSLALTPAVNHFGKGIGTPLHCNFTLTH